MNNFSKKHVIGIDVGGTNMRLALVTPSGQILKRIRMESRIHEGRQAFCDRLTDGINEIRGEAKKLDLVVDGIGIGVPGLIDKQGFIHSSVNMHALEGLNIRDYLEKAAGLPTFCRNDATMSAVGELLFGAARGLNSCIVLTIGTGLGSGLILNGSPWEGVDGYAAEFGHITVDPQGIPCTCGSRGCLEQYVSAGAITRQMYRNSGLKFQDTTSMANTEQIARWAHRGNQDALAAFASAGHYLGIALGGLVNVLNLQAAIICGGVAASLDLMLPALLQELSVRCFPQPLASFAIQRGLLGDNAGVIGAAAALRMCTKS